MFLRSKFYWIYWIETRATPISAKKSFQRRSPPITKFSRICCKDYWEGVSAELFESFYQANLALTEQQVPSFSFYDEKARSIRVRAHLPPTKLLDSAGNQVDGRQRVHSERMHGESARRRDAAVETGSVTKHFADDGHFTSWPAQTRHTLDCGRVPLGVGANTTIQRAIVDKNARIGRNVRIVDQDIQGSTREESGL